MNVALSPHEGLLLLDSLVALFTQSIPSALFRALIRMAMGWSLAVLLVGGNVFAQQIAAPETLRVNLGEAILEAINRSPEIDIAASTADFAEARYRFARANRFLTEFRATTAHAPAPGLKNPNDTPTDRLYLDPDVRNEWGALRPFNQIELEAVQPIYTWGELGGSIKAARYGVEVEEAAVRQKMLEVALRTGELYYGVLLADALSRLTLQAGQIVDQAKAEIRRLLDEGAPDVDDADEAQLLITEQEYFRRVAEVTQRRLTAYAGLTRQLFLPQGTVAAPRADVLQPIEFTPDSLETYFELALANRPELEQAAAGIQARDALVRVARSDYYPKLFLAGSARLAGTPGRYRQPNPYISDPLRGRGLQAGIGFRQNLNFVQTQARVEQAEAELNQVRYQLDAAQQLILFEVEDAYRNMLIARAALDAQNQALQLSKEWLRVETINFDLDLGDTENLVRAVQSNLELEINYLVAVRDYNVAVLRLLNATGTLVSRAESGTLVD